jgi:hypothetical protein
VTDSGYRRRGLKGAGYRGQLLTKRLSTARDHRGTREWQHDKNCKPCSGMQQSRTHRQSNSWWMKDSQQGQNDHRGERRLQCYAGGPKPSSTLNTVPIAAPNSEPHTTAMGWAIETFG